MKKLFLVAALVSLLVVQQAAQDKRGSEEIVLSVAGEEDQELYDASYALVIGVSKYTKGWKNLPGVVDDVSAITEVLKKNGFEVETSMDPSSAALMSAVSGFIARHGRREDAKHRLLIYFAGHGHTITTVDKRQLGYLVPADTPLPEMDMPGFKQTAISISVIKNWAEQIESKHALFVFDSCFSGMLFETRTRSVTPAISLKAALPVRLFITAGAADQTVPDKSIFREQFIRALNGAADTDGDNYVTGSELAIFLEDSVTNYSNKAQTPKWGKISNPDLDKGDFIFEVPGSEHRKKAEDSVNGVYRRFLDYWSKNPPKMDSEKNVGVQFFSVKGKTDTDGIFTTTSETLVNEPIPAFHIGDLFSILVTNNSNKDFYFTIFDTDASGRVQILQQNVNPTRANSAAEKTLLLRTSPPIGDDTFTIICTDRPVDFTVGGATRGTSDYLTAKKDVIMVKTVMTKVLQ